jgi:hypothetical protein
VGLKQWMMDGMLGAMSSEERQKMMGTMMDKFMASMTPDEKQGLMHSMMGASTSAAGGQGPAGKMRGMMAGMMGGRGRMGRMMSMMMGRKGTSDGHADETGDAPWDMCRRMMDAVGRANDLASYATPELRQIFEEWLGQIEGEILQAVNESGQADVGSLAQRFKLSAESVQFVLFRLARQGKIDLSAGTARAK